MMKNIVLIDMSNDGAPSGVNRYIECLSLGLRQYKDIQLYWVRLLSSRNMILHRFDFDNHLTTISIPIPESGYNIIREEFWMNNFADIVVDIASRSLPETGEFIFHLHTLNVIRIAQKFKQRFPSSQIITHLHCIPWKGRYNGRQEEFNDLCRKYYLTGDNQIERHDFETNFTEYDSYCLSDKIITVTCCAKEFLQRVMGIDKSKITVISNGMPDMTDGLRNGAQPTKRVKLLFVGSIIESKGIEIIAQAMRKVANRGVKVELRVAGVGNPLLVDKLKKENKDIRLRFLGRLNFEALKRQYRLCNIGIVASLQEQCSYAAIEMAMFAMPIITTAVDGLDEMFDDRLNCLKVPVKFNGRLVVDTDMMADHIVRLANDLSFAKQLGLSARSLYESKFSLHNMVKKTYKQYR